MSRTATASITPIRRETADIAFVLRDGTKLRQLRLHFTDPSLSAVLESKGLPPRSPLGSVVPFRLPATNYTAFLPAFFTYLCDGDTISPTELCSFLRAINLKAKFLKYDVTAEQNTQKDLHDWAKIEPFLAYAFACRELSWDEIVAVARVWIEYSPGYIFGEERDETADLSKPFHILPEEILQLKNFQELCQASISRLTRASLSLDGGKWSFVPCAHDDPGNRYTAGTIVNPRCKSDHFAPWFQEYTANIYEELCVTPSTRVLFNDELLPGPIAGCNTTRRCCLRSFRENLNRLRVVFAGEIRNDVNRIPFPPQ